MEILVRACQCHCILDTFRQSIQAQQVGESYLISDIATEIWEHAQNHFDLYQDFVAKVDRNEVMKEISEYIFNKEYRSKAVDLIPLMLANVYHVDIVIIDEFSNFNTTTTPSSGSSHASIYVLKRGQHYDALRPKPRRINTNRQ